MAVLLPSPSQTTVFSAGVNQGVIGGAVFRPTRRNVLDYGAVEGIAGSVATNNAAFSAARAACLSGQSIYFPPGIWNVSNLGLAWTLSDRTIEGAGMYETRLRIHSGYGFSLGVDPALGNFSVTATVLAGFAKGTTVFTTNQPITPNNGNNANFSVGRLVRILIPDDPSVPVVSVQGETNLRRRFARVVAWNNTTKELTIFPALDHDIAVTSNVIIQESQYVTQSRIGIQDMTIDGSPTSMIAGISAQSCDQLWIHRVKVENYANRGIHLTYSLCPEIRQCWMYGGSGSGTNKAGILFDTITHPLVEHNIAENTFPNIQINAGSVGGIIAYNYFPQVTDVNHSAMNSLNLYEGNITSYFFSDGYFGGNMKCLYFRNWSPSGILASFKRFEREPWFVGNICGTPGNVYTEIQYPNWGDPNIGNTNDNGRTAKPSVGSYWYDWDNTIPGARRWNATVLTKVSDSNATLQLDPGGGASLDFHLLDQGGSYATARASALGYSNFVGFSGIVGDVATVNYNSGVLPAVGVTFTLYPSALGWQEKDLDVFDLSFRRSNYFVFYGQIPVDEELPPGDTLPDSLYTKPADPLWGSLTYPPFDPYNVGTPAITDIPAGYFYTYGVWPNGAPPAPSDSTPNPLGNLSTKASKYRLF